MPRPPRLVRRVTDALWQRDKAQMRAAGTLLSALAPATRRRTRSQGPLATMRLPGGPGTGFHELLCPIDFSRYSRNALRYAAALAARDGAALTVIHANDPFLVSAAAAALRDRGLLKRSAVELRAFVDAAILAGSPARRRLTTSVSTGKAADEILKAASRGRCDLIVIGTRGLTAAGRLFLGSTTMRVLQRATVAVLAVPRSAKLSRRR